MNADFIQLAHPTNTQATYVDHTDQGSIYLSSLKYLSTIMQVGMDGLSDRELIFLDYGLDRAAPRHGVSLSSMPFYLFCPSSVVLSLGAHHYRRACKSWMINVVEHNVYLRCASGLSL